MNKHLEHLFDFPSTGSFGTAASIADQRPWEERLQLSPCPPEILHTASTFVD